MRQHNANIATSGVLSNPVAINLTFGGTLAPHALAQRDTYTVPAGRSARFVSGHLQHAILNAGSASGTIITLMRADLGGAGLVPIASLQSESLRADYIASSDIHGPYDFSGGDIITLHTLDETTGGTITHSMSAFLIEYG